MGARQRAAHAVGAGLLGRERGARRGRGAVAAPTRGRRRRALADCGTARSTSRTRRPARPRGRSSRRWGGGGAPRDDAPRGPPAPRARRRARGAAGRHARAARRVVASTTTSSRPAFAAQRRADPGAARVRAFVVGDPGFAMLAMRRRRGRDRRALRHPRRRAGRASARRCVEAALAAGGRDVAWIVADDEGRARALYERLGFETVWRPYSFVRRPPRDGGAAGRCQPETRRAPRSSVAAQQGWTLSPRECGGGWIVFNKSMTAFSTLAAPRALPADLAAETRLRSRPARLASPLAAANARRRLSSLG